MNRFFGILSLVLVPSMFHAVSASAQISDDPPYFESVFAQSLPNYIIVHPGLSRCGRPSPQGIATLKQNGFKTIINIEDDMKAVQYEQGMATQAGLNMISSPMSWRKAPSDQQVGEILKMMQDRTLWPVVLHCKHGRDRTGLVMGLYRVFVERWPAKKAYEEMLAAGFRPQLTALDRYFKEKTGYRGN